MPDPDLLSTLQPPTLQSVMAPMDTLGQIGVGLSGIGRGQNPALVEAQGQFRQQVELLRLQREVRDQRLRAQTLAMKMVPALLDAGGTAAETGARVFGETLSALGYSLPPTTLKEIGQRRLSLPDIDEIQRAKVQGVSLSEVQTAKRRLPPEVVQSIYDRPIPDEARKHFGLKSDADLQKERQALQRQKAEAWTASNPRFKDTGSLHGLAGYADEFVRSKYQRSLFDLAAENPGDARVLDLAHLYATERARSEYERTKRLESQITKERELEVAKGKLTVGPKPMSIRDQIAATASLSAAGTAVPEIHAMLASARSLNQEGYLPTTPAIASVKWAELTRWWSLSGDERVTLLNQLTSPVFIGQIDRVLNQEKGTRAMAMFQEQIKIVRQLPTLHAYERLLGLYEYLLARSAAREVRRLERMVGKIPDEVIEGAQEDFLRTFPKGVPPDPTALIGESRAR